MALNLFNKYGSRANPPSIDYPQGSVKNRTAPDVKDGTPLDADWANDIQGYLQSLLQDAGIVADGQVDKVGASQYFEALKAVIHNEGPSQATETDLGLIEIATQAEVNVGTDDARAVTPKKLKDGGFWPLGVGQQWVSVTSARDANTAYTNTTGRTIFVAIQSTSGVANIDRDFQVTDNSGAWINVGSTGGGTDYEFVAAPVPAGRSYRINGSAVIRSWAELR